MVLGQHVDAKSLNLQKTIFLFDLDGTLVPHRKKFSTEMKELLKRLRSKSTIAIVSGGHENRLMEQISEFEGIEYVFSQNGLVAFKNGVLINKQSLTNFLEEKKFESIKRFCTDYISKLTLPFNKSDGHLDILDCMINVTPCGRTGITYEERDIFEKFDNEHHVREKFIEALKAEFKDDKLNYVVGGQISFDIIPEGCDKRYCLQQLAKDGFESILFFGDKVYPGGNDYEIANDPKTIAFHVDSPEMTFAILTKLLDDMDK